MDYTKNYKLSKPSYDDDVDIQILNNNMDILDDNLKRNLDTFGQYLPLSGGKMQGNIIVPYDLGLKMNDNHFINFNTTNFNNKALPTLKLKSDRLKFYCPSGKEFIIDDTGAWFNNDKVIMDLYTDIGWYSGYTKLNTGLLLQWGYVNPQGSAGNVQHVTFKTPMINQQYAVVVSKSYGVDRSAPNKAGEWWSATYNFTTTGFDIVCDQPSYGHTVFWIAIGRGVK